MTGPHGSAADDSVADDSAAEDSAADDSAADDSAAEDSAADAAAGNDDAAGRPNAAAGEQAKPAGPVRAAAAAAPPAAPPKRRREPLPSQTPKPAADDAEAPQRLAALLASPTYRQADQDPDFLTLDATRGVRLQVDYLKAELLLAERGVEHTIVVFGGTRICEPRAARRRVIELEAELARAPGDAKAERRLEIARRIEAKSVYYDVARELGRLVGSCRASDDDCRVLLMTGGGPGVMEAANRGAFDAGAQSIGLNINLPHEQFPNPYITPDLCFRFHYFAMRKLHFLMRARALVAFPGGYGTLDEMFETLTLVQTRSIAPVPVVLVGESFWRGAVDFDFLVDEGVIAAEDCELFWYAETAEDIWASVLAWHVENGTPLLPSPCGP